MFQNRVKICGTDCEDGCGAVQPSKYESDLSKFMLNGKIKV